MDFHRVPNQVLYQAEPLPDRMQNTRSAADNVVFSKGRRQTTAFAAVAVTYYENYSIRR